MDNTATYNMIRYRLSATDLVWCWSLVSGRCGHRVAEVVLHDHEAASLRQVLGQDGAGGRLVPAVEVTGHVVRHRAVLAADPLEARLGPLQGVGKLECTVGRSLAWRLKYNHV